MNLNPINSRLRVSLGGAIILAMFAALPARADTYQSTVLAQNPAGYWRLNETTQPAPNATTPNLGSLGSSALGTYIASPTHGKSCRRLRRHLAVRLHSLGDRAQRQHIQF
jgi:hypothetical protein